MTPTPPRFTLHSNARVGQVFSGVVASEPAVAGPENAARVIVHGVVCPPETMTDAAFDPATRVFTGTPQVAGELVLEVVYGYETPNDGPTEAPAAVTAEASTDAEATATPVIPLPATPAPRLTAPLALFVNADPRTLWKNLPSDANGPDAKPDAASAGWLVQAPAPATPEPAADAGTAALPPRLLLAASQRGRSHAHTGVWRDDDFAVSAGGKWQVVVVADGAGSASRSRRGAQIAVKVALEHISQTLEAASLDELASSLQTPGHDPERPTAPVANLAFRALGHAAHSALKAIDAEAATHDLTRRDYNTTLLLAAHARLPADAGHLYLAYQIGDGLIGVYTPGETAAASVVLLGTPDSGAYAGQTRFLDAEAVGSTDAIRERLVIHRRDAFAPLLVMSDGVSDPYFESDAAIHDAAIWNRLWADITPMIDAGLAAGGSPSAAGEQLAEWLNFFTPGHHDDRTLAVLV